MKRYVLVSITLILAGCIRYYFQPPKPEYQNWSNQGASELDVKKALLECGMPSPDPTSGIYEHAFGYHTEDEIVNRYLASVACMEHAGYKPSTDTFRESCAWDYHKHLPICQPDAEIPAPSVERRLNSYHCKLETSRAYCLKHAINPPACEPDLDTRPSPSECVR